MKNKILIALLWIVFITSVIGFSTFSQNAVLYDVDFTLGNDGIVRVLYNTGKDIKVKLIIENASTKYTYNLKSDDEYVNFPLQMGDGEYNVKIYENTTGSKYKNVYGEKTYVKVEDTTAAYLASSQQVRWSKDDDAIKLAQKLMDDALTAKVKSTSNKKATLTDMEKINVIYNYVIQNMDYDYNKIKTLNYDYVPDIDTVLKAGKGICFDYSVLLAAMLRSQNVPVKLIKGYSTNTDVYHAWNEIYITSEKRWIIVDTTYDAYMYDNKFAYSMEKTTKEYTKEYEF